ncbi:alpha/beta hydrolase [Niabella sp. W65]|nr:alpha/beta hydrolase [Niabella sp. W65]MCH7369343.1 alpha/beta hydrolase [Niabella sp. W65]
MLQPRIIRVYRSYQLVQKPGSKLAFHGEHNPIIHQPTLMIYGERDTIPKSKNLKNIVPNLDIASLDCGHWIQQEKPEETTQLILEWLEQQNA